MLEVGINGLDQGALGAFLPGDLVPRFGVQTTGKPKLIPLTLAYDLRAAADR